MAKTSQSIEKPGIFHILLVLLLAVIWGSSFIAMKISVFNFGPFGTAAGRVAIGFVFLVPWALYRGLIWPDGWRQWVLVMIVTWLGIVIPFVMTPWALQEIEAGRASLLLAITPFVALILGHFFTDDDRLNRFKITGVLIGFVGLLFAIRTDLTSNDSQRLWASLAVVVSAVSYSISGTALRFIRGIPTTRLSCLTLGLATPFLLVGTWLFSPDEGFVIDKSSILTLVYLGVVPTALASLMRFYLIPRIGMSWFSQSLNLIPIFGIAFGAIILGESITFSLILGLALVILGLIISRKSPKNVIHDRLY